MSSLNFENDVQPLVLAMESAVASDVPVYAPTRWGEALGLWRQIQQDAVSGAEAHHLRRQLDEAIDLLRSATQQAGEARGRLSDLVQRRASSQRSLGGRRHAPEILAAAERDFRYAMEAAERGDFAESDRHAASARGRYAEAEVAALERSDIAQIAGRVAEAERVVPSARLKEATRELDQLRAAVREARQGKRKPSELRTTIGFGRITIDSLLDPPVIGGGIISGDLGLHPETIGPPEAPLTMRITGRSESTVTITWRNRSAYADTNKLERQENGGPWVVVAEFGPLGGLTTHTDTGLKSDTLYCYRVRTENAFGANTTPDMQRACAYTRDGNELGVWRIQLTIRTADFPGAGTSDPVRVHLNSPLLTHAPFGNHTWLDYAPRLESTSLPTAPFWTDDFDRGREFTYDLNVDGIGDFSDITMISIVKEGSDAWAIAEMSLAVNEKQVFHRFFGETASTCLMLDAESGSTSRYTVFHSELRGHGDWQEYIASPRKLPQELRISSDHLASRLEAMVGHEIHDTELYWRHHTRPVEIERLDDQTIEVKFRMRVSVPVLPDSYATLTLHLHFDVVCDAEAETAILVVTSLHFDASVSHHLLALAIMIFFTEKIEETIERGFKPIAQAISLDAGNVCPKVFVDEFNNIQFDVTQ